MANAGRFQKFHPVRGAKFIIFLPDMVKSPFGILPKKGIASPIDKHLRPGSHLGGDIRQIPDKQNPFNIIAGMVVGPRPEGGPETAQISLHIAGATLL